MGKIIESCSIVGVICCVAFAAIALTPAQAASRTIHVDYSAAPGGNGSKKRPVQTIEEGIEMLPKNGGTVLIQPGTYVVGTAERAGLVVERSNVTLRGDATPIYDGDGFLMGFDEEVVITIDRVLEDPGFIDGLGQPEDLIELRGSNNEVHNVVVETQGLFEDFNAAVSARAEDDDFYTNIVFSHIIVRGVMDTGGWTSKANALFEHITALDGGIVGIQPTGVGHVEINKVDLANWRNVVCFLGPTETPVDDNGSSNLTGTVNDSRLSDASQAALLLLGQVEPLVDPAAPVTMEVVAEGNTFQDSRFAIRLQPVNDEDLNTASRDLTLRVDDNTYIGNSPLPAESEILVNFFSDGTHAGTFVRDSMIVVEDGDGVFPDPSDVNVGPAKFGNSYVLEVLE